MRTLILTISLLCLGLGASFGCADGGSLEDAGTDTGVADSDTPDSETPDAETPDSDTPDVDTPDTDVPDADEPDADEPDASEPDADTPDASEPDADTPDAEPDADMPDADTPDSGCTGPEDCDDGDACNGAETCAGGTCMPGTPLDCDDGVSCTVDSCSGGACNNAPNDGMCLAGLVCDVDDGCIDPACSASPCETVSPQCGCGAGEACYLTAEGRTCAVAGSVALRGDCSSALCAPGSQCITDGEGAAMTSLCRQACNDDADCTEGPGASCQIGLTGRDDTVCTYNCNAAARTGCPSGTGCDLFRSTSGRTFTDCDTGRGTGTQGSTCTVRSDCAEGFSCFGPEGSRQCLRWCTFPAGSECSGATTCFHFTDELIFDGVEYGVCDTPG